MNPRLAGLILLIPPAVFGKAQSDGALLREHLRQTYPSLAYVARYRSAFPAETQGTDALWASGGPLPRLRAPRDLVQALAGLEDQHVSLAGPKAGATETLGVLFRTSSDGRMVVWRVFDPSIQGVREGDEVLAVDGHPTRAWLKRSAALTFGGNRRSRMAESALELGLGHRLVHAVNGLGSSVTLTLATGSGETRKQVLAFLPMTEARAASMAGAINRADLPSTFEAGGLHIATLRLGAFAPQYDPAFQAASDEAAKRPGTSDDQAMLAGFQAVVRTFIAQADAAEAKADVLVLDLRGNMGGFGREARLLADALAASPLPKSFDVFASGKPGMLRLEQQPEDPSCGHVKLRRPLIVLTDAGTRSAGELMAAWLWGSGAIVAGECTIGAGGGFEFQSKGFLLPHSGLAVITSGNFTFFDSGHTLREGDTPERPLITRVAQDHFAPSRARPFAIQAAGLRPDLEARTTLEDLRDGGVAEVQRLVASLKRRGALP